MTATTAATATNPLLAAALDYAGRGWRVVPLHSLTRRDGRLACSCGRGAECAESGQGGKHPRVARWPQVATTEPSSIRHWWQEVPAGNVGVALGSASGIVAVDVDPPGGEAFLAAIAAGDLPDTLELRTGKGRRLLYAIPAGVPDPKTCCWKDADDNEAVRLQGTGGQCVMPPSLHPLGRRYAWAEGRGPGDLEPAPMPGWCLAEMCRPEQPAWADPPTHGPADSFPPGADLNRRAEWDRWLVDAGYKPAGRRGDVTYWTRPGKRGGVSVTLGHYRARDGSPALYVFSGNCPHLLAGKCYDLFGFVARTVHGGDFAAAARSLGGQGYGEHRTRPAPRAGNGHPAAVSGGPPPAHAAGRVEVDPDLDVSANPWPDPLGAAALHGLAGDVVRAIDPHTEADPAAILFQFLAAFGNMVGRGPHYRVEDSRHYPNLFVVLVGQSARARKGTSWQRVSQLLATGGDQGWVQARVTSGLSSGEGLIWEVRDAIHKRQPVRSQGHTTGHEDVEVDPGVADKRAMVIEEEFATVLQVGKREGNILGGVIRSAWDTGNLGTLVKNSPARATGAHVSIIGHITRRELLDTILATQAHNGFSNRFLWVAVRRSKLLPLGGRPIDWTDAAADLKDAHRYASDARRAIPMSALARRLWIEEYPRLTADRPGLFGAVTSRAEAQTIRLALIYSLLDCSPVIDEAHLRAALDLVRYAEQSARNVFGDAVGDPVADEIRCLLRANPVGVSESAIRDHFGRNRSRAELQRSLRQLVELGMARSEKTQTSKPGRPVVIWISNDLNAVIAAGG